MAIRLGEILKRLPTKTAWFIAGLIPRGAVTMIVGIPSAGKSELIRSIIRACYVGMASWLGCAISRQRRDVILLCDVETSPQYVQNVMQRHSHSRKPSRQRANAMEVVVESDTHYIDTPKGQQEILALVKLWKATVLIIDTLRGHSARPGETPDILQPTLNWLRDLAYKENLAVVLLVHSRKNGAEQQAVKGNINSASGSFALMGAADVAYEYRRANQFGALMAIRTKGPTIVNEIPIELRPVEGGPQDWGYHELVLADSGIVHAALAEQLVADIKKQAASSKNRGALIEEILTAFMEEHPTAQLVEMVSHLTERLGLSRQAAYTHANKWLAKHGEAPF